MLQVTCLLVYLVRCIFMQVDKQAEAMTLPAENEML